MPLLKMEVIGYQTCTHICQLKQSMTSYRWLDKGVTITCHANGRCGINVEHTTLDATVTNSFIKSLKIYYLQVIAQLSEYASYYENYDEYGHIIDDGASDIDVELPTK